MSRHSFATSRCLSLLEKCKNMEQLKQAHSLVFTSGLGSNTYALSRVLAFCSDPHRGSSSYAWKIFQHIQNPTICIWNTMFKALLLGNELVQFMSLYREMLRSDSVVPDNYTLPYVLKACTRLRSSFHGELVHGQALKSGLVFDIFVGNSLISMYGEVHDVEAARQVFDEMSELNVVSWMVMISGYGKMSSVENARLFFDLAPVRDVGIWGAMISGYVQNGCFKEGLSLFHMMLETGVTPDEAVFVSVICACAHLGDLDVGIWIHKRLYRLRISSSVRIGTGLIDMYAKCGNLELAERLFRGIPEKDVVCWNVMISAMAIHGRGESALELFGAMEQSGVTPDDITFIAVFTACSYSGMASEGIRLLERMRSVYRIEPKSEHYGCIVDLLSRAGLFDEAKELIQRVISITSDSDSSQEVAWRAFLSACYEHGQAHLAQRAVEKLSRSEWGSGFYILLSNLSMAAGKGADADSVRNLMKSRGVQKVPGCSSVEVDGTIYEFTAGETMNKHIEEICAVLENISKQ